MLLYEVWRLRAASGYSLVESPEYDLLSGITKACGHGVPRLLTYWPELSFSPFHLSILPEFLLAE